MGHAIDYGIVGKREDIMEYAREFAFYNTDRGENPTGSYHGNLTIHDSIVCDNIDDARKQIRGWDKGFYSDHAVRFRDTESLSPSKAETAISERISAMLTKKKGYIDSHMVNSLKSQLITCSKCGSKLNVHHPYFTFTNECPVCRTDLRAEYILERIRKYDADIEELKKKKLDMCHNRKGNAPVKWLVKVEVHC